MDSNQYAIELVTYSNTLFFTHESNVLPFLNITYSVHNFVIELLDLQSQKIFKSVFFVSETLNIY